MKRRPGKSILELATRIRQDAVTCDFVSIKDPLDEAMRTHFMCSVNNEAVLKALFKVKDVELTFAKAISVVVETEDAAKAHAHVVAKRTTGPGIVHSKESICNYCQKIGHLQSVCLQKRKDSHTVTVITKRKLWSVKRSPSTPARLVRVSFEVDTGAGDNFCSMDVWMKLGKPALTPTTSRYEVANGTTTRTESISFTVSKVSRLNLLGRDAIVRLCINLMALLGIPSVLPSTGGSNGAKAVPPILKDLKPDVALQEACKRVCQDFPDLFKQKLGCLKDFQLEIQFKPDSNPYSFNSYGTPVVPIRKKAAAEGSNPLCGDYSLSGSYGFSKIDLADANYVSQKRLALSTHRGVLLQLQLHFGISSAPAHFQEIMDQLTSDLKRA
ncbi:hypothetical protein EMCRGX_G019800 [Ephydatia muelleri]